MAEQIPPGIGPGQLPVQHQGSTAIAAYDPYLNPPSDDDDGLDLRELWRTVLKYRWTILGVLVLALATTAVATLLMRPVYRSSALLEVDPNRQNIVKFQNVDEANIASKEYAETQANILRSESVARAVIEALELEKTPEFSGDMDQRGIIAGVKGVVKVIMGDDPDQAGSEDATIRKERGLMGRFSERLTVAPIRRSNLFDVSFDSFDPRLSARIANEVVAQFINLNDSRRFGSTSGAKAFLEREIARVQARLETSEKDLTEFARRYQIVDIEDRSNIVEIRLQDLSKNYTEVKAQRIAAESLYIQASGGQADSMVTVLDEPLITRLKQELATLRAQYTELSKIYKPAYPDLVKLQAKIEETEATLRQEIYRVVQSLKLRYQELTEKERLLDEELERQKEQLLNVRDRAIQYNILKREWETNKELYSGLLERMKEVGVAAGMELTNISVIDPAAVSMRPHSPRLLLNLALAGVLGLTGGLGLAFLLAYLDNTVRNPEELERAAHLTSFGMVPLRSSEKGGALERSRFDLLAADFPDDGMAEAFRSVRTSLMFSTPEGIPKTLLVTSATAGEGKSTTICNLAIVLAQNNLRVLLIDCDLRKPRLHRTFEMPSSPGLSEALVGNESQIVRQTRVPGLSFVPSGTPPPNPAELLSSMRLNEFLAEQNEHFDVILLDTAPILGLADTIVLSTKVKGALLVVSSANVSRDALRESVKRLRHVRAPLIGAVLNRVDISSREYGYYNRYYYNYGSNEDDQGAGRKRRSKKSRKHKPTGEPAEEQETFAKG
jgi:succinoglycan biosynthesis transport protein ExoP